MSGSSRLISEDARESEEERAFFATRGRLAQTYMIAKILHDLSLLFTSLNSSHAIERYKLQEEIDRLHATLNGYRVMLNEYRAGELVLRARIEELEEMVAGNPTYTGFNARWKESHS